MESQGLVMRGVSCDRPIAVTYEITDFFRTALDINYISALCSGSLNSSISATVFSMVFGLYEK